VALRGFLDGVAAGQVHGWAVDTGDSFQSSEIDIFVDDEWVATVTADLFRSDLRDNQIGEGRHGFTYDLPAMLVDGGEHLVSARFCATGRELLQSPRRVILGERFEAAAEQKVMPDRPIEPLMAELRQGGRLAIIASFLRKPRLLGYHHALARSLRDLGFKVVVVQNVLELAEPPFEAGVDLFVARGNAGFDFGAWHSTLNLLNEAVGGLSELVLTNDSIFGPLFDLAKVFEKMNASPADVWGITDSWERAYHLQSYFLVLKRSALAGQALSSFRAAYAQPKSKSGVIELGEIGLTQTLLAAGLKVAAYCPYREVAAAWLGGLQERLSRLNGRAELALFRAETSPELRTYQSIVQRLRRGLPVNPTHAFWDTLLQSFGCPFIKRDLLFFNPAGMPNLCEVGPAIRSVSSYPLELVEEARASGPVRLAQPIFIDS
jgi:Rhamnan synthesis protein F